MGTSSGQLPAPIGTNVTREVRWFHDGVISPDVLSWFTREGALGLTEQRTDRYDLPSAALGLGVKQRGTDTFDVKYRIGVEEGVELSPGLIGNVEDWVKVTMPLVPGVAERVAEPVVVEKRIVTRRYLFTALDTADERAGCDAEIAAVTIGGRMAWSFCCETFGAADVRAAAFVAGLRAVVEETPLIDGCEIASAVSCGYPLWLASGGAQEPRADRQ